MLIESMVQVAKMERDEQLRKAERRHRLVEYPGARSGGFAGSVKDAFASVRTGFSRRQLVHFRGTDRRGACC